MFCTDKKVKNKKQNKKNVNKQEIYICNNKNWLHFKKICVQNKKMLQK